MYLPAGTSEWSPRNEAITPPNMRGLSGASSKYSFQTCCILHTHPHQKKLDAKQRKRSVRRSHLGELLRPGSGLHSSICDRRQREERSGEGKMRTDGVGSDEALALGELSSGLDVDLCEVR